MARPIPRAIQAYFITLFFNLGPGWLQVWFKNGLEPPGAIFPKDGPVASRGDPFRVQNDMIMPIHFFAQTQNHAP